MSAAHSLSRRELLALLAGVPVAGLVGCGSGGAIDFDGELLGPDLSFGHRLRDGWRPEEPTGTAEKQRVVIVGGGIAGLSAAWQLRHLGIQDYVVLELDGRPGGTSMSGEGAGFKFPWGAHYVPLPMKDNTSLVELFQQMNVIVGHGDDGEPIAAEQFLCRDPEERVYHDGAWTGGLYPHRGASEEDLAELQRFQDQMQTLAARRDDSGRRWFAIPMATGSDSPEVRELDQISMARWMADQGYSSARLNWLVDYACRDDYGLTTEQTSAWAGLFYFASRLRGDGSESQPVLTRPEGNGRIVQFLANACGERLRLGHGVTQVRDGGDAGVRVRAFDTQSSQTRDFIADDVIFASPQFLAPHLIANWRRSARTLQSFRYGGWVVANLWIDDRPAEERGGMCWDNVIYNSRALGYVTSTHQTGLDHGASVLTWYEPLLDDDPRVSRTELMRLSWRDWATVIVSDLQKAHPEIASLIRRMDVMRWGHAMIQPRVGFVWGGEREAAAQSLGRIHFAGTDLSGVALMEEAFDRGIRAAEKCVS